MRLPERKDILDYVEEAAGQDADVQRHILNMLASSSVMREQIVELKKDLYLVSAQVPDYAPDVAFGADVAKLAQTWLQLSYNRKFSVKNFHRSREFFGLLVVVGGGLLLLLALIGVQLMR